MESIVNFLRVSLKRIRNMKELFVSWSIKRRINLGWTCYFGGYRKGVYDILMIFISIKEKESFFFLRENCMRREGMYFSGFGNLG